MTCKVTYERTPCPELLLFTLYLSSSLAKQSRTRHIKLGQYSSNYFHLLPEMKYIAVRLNFFICFFKILHSDMTEI